MQLAVDRAEPRLLLPQVDARLRSVPLDAGEFRIPAVQPRADAPVVHLRQVCDDRDREGDQRQRNEERAFDPDRDPERQQAAQQ